MARKPKDESPPCTFVRKVKAALDVKKPHGKLQKELGDMLGENEQEFSKTLKRATRPYNDLPRIVKIARYLEVPIDWLLDEDPDLTVPDRDGLMYVAGEERQLLESMRFMELTVADVRHLISAAGKARDLGVPPADVQPQPRRRGSNNDR